MFDKKLKQIDYHVLSNQVFKKYLEVDWKESFKEENMEKFLTNVATEINDNSVVLQYLD